MGPIGVAMVVAMMVVVLGGGCASSLASHADARSAFYRGEFEVARESLAELAGGRGGNDCVQLDLAIAELAAGQSRHAVKRLSRLRDRLDAAGLADAKLNPAGDAASMVLDDNVRPFRLAAEEQTLLRTLLAIAELPAGGVDAESYSLQAVTHRRELLERGVLPPDRDVALSMYVRGLIRESNHHDYDDAHAAYQMVAAAEPQFAPIGHDIARAGGGVHSAAGNGVLYVFVMAGRGPVLVQSDAVATTEALQIASAVWSARQHSEDDSPAIGLPNIATVKVPTVLVPPSPTDSVAISINGQPLGKSQTITDVAEIASRRMEDQMPTILVRAILRRAAKEAAVAASASAIGLQGNAASLFQFAAGSGLSSLERADTRCWSLLPREFQVFRVELPIGEHQFSWQPIDIVGQPCGRGGGSRVTIEDGRNAYQVVVAP